MQKKHYPFFIYYGFINPKLNQMVILTLMLLYIMILSINLNKNIFKIL